MNTTASPLKTVALAVALAAGIASTAHADDSSMDIWTGDSYRAFNGGQNFPYGNPVIDKSPSQFRITNPNGLSNAQYAALSQEDPMAQIPVPRNLEAERIATAEAQAWRRANPQGLTEREYQSLSANSPVWQLPEPGSPAAVAEAQPAMTVAQLRERLAHLFGANRTTSN